MACGCNQEWWTFEPWHLAAGELKLPSLGWELQPWGLSSYRPEIAPTERREELKNAWDLLVVRNIQPTWMYTHTPWSWTTKIINHLHPLHPKYKFKKYTSESTNGSIQQLLVYKSPHDNWLCLIQTPHSSYHSTSMYELPRGPHLLRFLNVDKATLNLPVLTGNGVGNVITIGPEIQPPNDRQIVRLDIFSICVIDRPNYSGFLCP